MKKYIVNKCPSCRERIYTDWTDDCVVYGKGYTTITRACPECSVGFTESILNYEVVYA